MVRRRIETRVELLAMCICWAIFNGRGVTERSTFGSTPDGGTKTGAGGESGSIPQHPDTDWAGLALSPGGKEPVVRRVGSGNT
jgi:hypothetical protein